MAEFTFQMEIYASPKAIWEMYVDFTKRRQWETDLEYINLNGAFATGAVGTMKLVGQPEMPYTITEAIPYNKYWDRTEIPGMGIAICFGHEFLSNCNSTVVKVSAKIEKSNGELSDEEILLLAQIFSDTPQSVLAIKKLVER